MNYETAVRLHMDELARAHGAEFVDIHTDMGTIITLPYWTQPQFSATLEDVAQRIKDADGVVLEGRASYAFMGAIVHNAYPRPCAQFVRAHGPLLHDIYEDFLILKQGEYDPAGQINFELEERGDDVYLSFMVDDGTNAGHAYDDRLLPLVKVPPIAPGKRIFIRGITKYSIAISIAEAYRDTAKSVYMLYRADSEYICAYSNCPEDIPGARLPAQK